MILRNFLRFVWVVALQVLLFNNIQFSGYINPYFYILFILLLPLKTPSWIRLVAAFIIGFTIDIFSQSPGLHTSASVLIAFIQPYIISSLKMKGDIDSEKEPNLSNMGFRWFINYALILILIHHSYYFLLEAFSFSNLLNTFYRIIISSFITFIAIILSQLFNYKKTQ